MTVFPDTNVLVSSFTSNGLSRKLVDILLTEHDIVVSPQVIEEFRRIVLAKFVVDEIELDTFIRRLLSVGTLSSPPYLVTCPVRDPDDINLAAAVKGNSDVLVTGDKDLLDIVDPPIPILTPRALYDLLIAIK